MRIHKISPMGTRSTTTELVPLSKTTLSDKFEEVVFEVEAPKAGLFLRLMSEKKV